MMFLQRLSLGMFGWRCSFFEPFLLACLLGWVVWRIKRWYTALAGDDWMACMTFLTFFSLSLFFFPFVHVNYFASLCVACFGYGAQH